MISEPREDGQGPQAVERGHVSCFLDTRICHRTFPYYINRQALYFPESILPDSAAN
jgi:hypothetical protein